MRLEVFGKTGCAKCKSAKEKLTHILGKVDMTLSVPLVFLDLDTVEGMAEGAFNDIIDLPTIILRSDTDEVQGRWNGKAPLSTEILKLLGVTKDVGAVE
jgi:glutaredoxin